MITESHYNISKASGSVFMAAAVVIGHFAPFWLVGILAGGWMFNAIVYGYRAGSETQ